MLITIHNQLTLTTQIFVILHARCFDFAQHDIYFVILNFVKNLAVCTRDVSTSLNMTYTLSF